MKKLIKSLKQCQLCNDCTFCFYKMLDKYNLLANAYFLSKFAYKYLFTLSVTETACEQSFSTFQFIKNKLRNNDIRKFKFFDAYVYRELASLTKLVIF